MAINLLRVVCGEFFGNTVVVGYLLGQRAGPDFWRAVKVLGETAASTGRFTPFTNPSNFHTDDGPALRAAEKIVRAYVAASTQCPDFQEIKAQFDLPDPEEARSLLPKN